MQGLDLTREQSNMEREIDAASRTVQLVEAASTFSRCFEEELRLNGVLRRGATVPISAAQLAAAFKDTDLSPVLSPHSGFALLTHSYGYESWLIAPEQGLRCVVREALERYRPAMEGAAGQVRDALLQAASAALAHLSGLPEGEQELLLAKAEGCIRDWHQAVQEQLQAVLAAEQACPDSKRFEAVRQQVAQALATSGAAAAQAQPVAAKPQVPASAQGTGVGSAGDQAPQAQPQTEAVYFMGYLLKRNRHSRWQRRWLVLDGGTRRLLMGRQPGHAPSKVVALAGAQLVLGEAASDGLPSKQRRGHMLSLLLPNGTLLTLSADSASVRSAWQEQLQAAIAGEGAAKGEQHGSRQEGAAPAQGPAKLVSQGSTESSQPEAPGRHGGPVPRKISTAVFAEEPDTADRAAAEVLEGDASQQGAERGGKEEEEALVAAIASAAAERQPTEQEAAVLSLVLAAAAAYVEAAAERLQGLTQRLVSTGLLLERREALRQGLLGMLLEG